MYNIGFFLVGAFLLLCGRLAWKQTLEEHQALAKTQIEPVAPFWALKPVAIIVILLGTFLILASIIIPLNKLLK